MMSLERQVRALLRAWPAPDRADRGEEILATTLALVPGTRGRLPARLVVSLLSGGLLARWRARPPIWRWWLYHTGFLRLPPRWHPWMLDTLIRRGWRRRIALGGFLAWNAPIQGGLFVLSYPDPVISAPRRGSVGLLTLVVGAAVMVLFAAAAGIQRRTRLAEHGYDVAGRPEGTWMWVRRGPAAPNLRLVPVMLAIGLPSMVVAVLASFALFHQHPIEIRLPGALVSAPPPPATAGRSMLITAGVSAGLTVILGAWVALAALRRRPPEPSGHADPEGAQQADPVSQRATQWSSRAAGMSIVAFGTWLVPITAIQGVGWKWAQLAVASGSIGAVLVMLALIVYRIERRLGRLVGAWDAIPCWRHAGPGADPGQARYLRRRLPGRLRRL